MPYHPDIHGSPTDPDSFPSHYRDRHSFPRGDLRHFRERHFSPSARQSSDDILRGLKGRLRPGPSADMFFNDCFFTPDAMFAKADEGEDAGGTLRGRHPHMQPQTGFHVPAWVSDDQDMSDLAARMSHAPHFATMGRRGMPGGAGVPWRERRHSGGSAMSVTSEDDGGDPVDRSQGGDQTVPHEIPIRFEAPPPPSQLPQGQGQGQHPGHPPSQPQHHAAQDGQDRPPQCPVRTTSAVDATEHTNSGAPRNSRCASAPPEMAEMQQQQQQQQHQQEAPSQQQQQHPQRFVSKINITPQAPASPQSSPAFSPLPAKFNTVPRPFVPGEQQQPQQQQHPQQQYPQQQQQYPYQQYPQFQGYQQPPLGFFPPADAQWQYQQQYPTQQAQQEAQAPQQRPAGGSSGQRPSVVRNIPIFVEGRDEPVEQTDSRPQQQWTQARPTQQAQQPQPQQPQVPQPPPPPPPQSKQKQKRQQAQQAHQATPPPHPVPIPMPDAQPTQQQDATPPQPQTQPQAPPPPPPPPQPQQDRRITEIEKVRGTVAELREKVDVFQGTKNDREFLYLDEMLTRALLQLDNVDPDGCDQVRQARRGVIKDINNAITKLESLAKDPAKDCNSNDAAAAGQDADHSSTPVGDAEAGKKAEEKENKKEEEEGKESSKEKKKTEEISS